MLCSIHQLPYTPSAVPSDCQVCKTKVKVLLHSGYVANVGDWAAGFVTSSFVQEQSIQPPPIKCENSENRILFAIALRGESQRKHTN